MKKDNFQRYTEICYSGKELLKKHCLDEFGQWQVFGEDPNCDLGGHHYEPPLGVFAGKLEDIIKHAVNLSGFWQWGGGGRIEKINIITISPEANEKRIKLNKEKEIILKRLKEIDEQLLT